MILQPPSVLLAGPTGTGKTSSLATAAKAGLDVFSIVTEPGGVESLLDSFARIGAPIEKLHWATAMPAAQGFSAFEDMIQKISSMDFEAISKIKDGIGKSETRTAALTLLNSLKNFKCERTGNFYGDFTSWDDTRLLALDSLTGLSIIGFKLTVGYKPTAHMGEWNIAMNFVHDLLVKINSDRKCFFAMTAHLEKEMDELTSVKKMTISTIGSKLAPKIPPFFSEVVRTSKVVDPKGGPPKFEWSTLSTEMDLKNRALPMQATLPADFTPIVDAHRRRKTAAAPSQTAATTTPAT